MSVQEHRQTNIGSVRCAIITVSDTRTSDTDSSARAIADLLGAGGHDVALRRIARGAPLPDDMHAILRRAEDWQFFTSGRDAVLDAQAVRITFGHEPDGTMLSDHIGYTALYRLGPDANRRGAA